ncbi:restriction endonuclease subunit S domain-containing protein [Microbacterium mangrovi]
MENRAHWPTRKLKTAVRLITDRAAGDEWKVGLENIEGWTGSLISADGSFEGAGIAFRIGDVLFGKLRPYLAKAWVADRPGAAVGDFLVLRPSHELDSRFLANSLLIPEQIESITSSVYGAKMPRANWDFIRELEISLPPLAVQHAVVCGLERETAEIDAFIADQEDLISLLTERRAATITRAVTKGLDPAVRMKDSGLHFAGIIPCTWAVVKLKRLGSIRYGIGEPPPYVGDGTPLIRATNVSEGHISGDRMVFVDPSDIPQQRILWLEYGDIIVVRSGALTGDSALVPSQYARSIAGFDMVFRASAGVEPRFIQYALLSTYVRMAQLEVASARAAQPHLNAQELGDALIAVGSFEDQRAIADYLDRETAELDAAIADAREAIALSRERRGALISAAVTGKIDVRGAA